MSHYQTYFNAVGAQDPKRTTSSPLPNSIPRKPASYSTIPNTVPTTSSPLNSKPSSAAPSIHSLRQNITSPTPAAEFAIAAKRTALAAHSAHLSPSASKAPEPATAPTPSTPRKFQNQHSIPQHQQNTTALKQIPNNPPNTYSMSPSQISLSLQRTLSLLQTAILHHAKYPSASLLLAPDNTSILLSHFSLSPVKHATSELVRLAADHFSSEFLKNCTVVSAWEPCAMCAGGIWWSGIGRIIYAAGGKTSEGVNIPCRTMLCSKQKKIEVIGPIPEFEAKVLEASRPWFAEHGGGGAVGVNGANSNFNGVNGNGIQGHSKAESGSVATTWTGEDSVLSSIGEDGEYKADLDIDWMR